MLRLSGNGLKACLRGDGVKINATITPRKDEIKPTILSTDGAVPPVLDGIKYNSDRPLDWQEWSGIGVIINGNGVALTPGQVEGYAVISLYLGYQPILDFLRFTSTGTATVQFRTAVTIDALNSAAYGDEYTSGDTLNYSCNYWLGIRINLADAGSASSLIDLDIRYSNQLYIPKVVKWGTISGQLMDNGTAHSTFSPTLHNWARKLAQSNMLSKQIAVVASFGTREAKDYLGLWEGSVSKISDTSIVGGLASEYLIQNFIRYQMADGTYWPTPFGDFKDSVYYLIDEPQVANYETGSRLYVDSVSTGSDGFQTARITITRDGSAWKVNADTFKASHTGTTSLIIKNENDEIVTTIGVRAVSLQDGDFVTVYLFKGGRCPAPFHGINDDDRRIHILAQWPIDSVTSVWSDDILIPSNYYTEELAADYAGKQNISYLKLYQIAQASETISYTGSKYYSDYDPDTWGIDNSTVTGTPTNGAESGVYVNIKTSLTGYKAWTSGSEPASYTAITVGENYDIGHGLSISWTAVPTGSQTDTINCYDKSGMEWVSITPNPNDDRLIDRDEYFTGAVKFEVDTVSESGTAAVKIYVDDEDTGDTIAIDGTGNKTWRGLDFSFPKGKANNKRLKGDSWQFTVSELDYDIKYCGIGIDGSTTLPDIIQSIVSWSPSYSYYLSRRILGSVAELPTYSIAGQLPARKMTIEHVIRELVQNIADLDATPGYIRFVMQNHDVPAASFHVSPKHMTRPVEYAGTDFNDIQNDITIGYGDQFHSNRNVNLRRRDQASIGRWERMTGHGDSWAASVAYPYTVDKDDAETICQNRLNYKKNLVRYYRIELNSPIHLFTEIGDKHLKFTDYWIPNDTYITDGVSEQPCRVVGYVKDLDGQTTRLLVEVVGNMEEPPEQVVIGGPEEIYFGWNKPGAGWGQAPWKNPQNKRTEMI